MKRRLTPMYLTAGPLLLPVASASATQSRTRNVTNVSGTISPPTGAATAGPSNSLHVSDYGLAASMASEGAL